MCVRACKQARQNNFPHWGGLAPFGPPSLRYFILALHAVCSSRASASFYSTSVTYMKLPSTGVRVVSNFRGKEIWIGTYSSHARGSVLKNTCRTDVRARPQNALSLTAHKRNSASGCMYTGSQTCARQHEGVYPSVRRAVDPKNPRIS